MTKGRPDEADSADEADRSSTLQASNASRAGMSLLQPLGTLRAEGTTLHAKELPERP
jgi:hypothetical protein